MYTRETTEIMHNGSYRSLFIRPKTNKPYRLLLTTCGNKLASIAIFHISLLTFGGYLGKQLLHGIAACF